MTAHKDLDTVLDAFFAEGPSEIADDVIEASLRLIDTTDQRRAGFGSRRTRSMSTLTRFSIAAAAVLTVAVLGTIVLPGLSRTAGTSPAPTTSPRAIAVAPSINVSSGVPSSAPSASAADALLAPLGYAAGGTILFTRSVPELPDQLSVSTIRPDGTGETPLRITSAAGVLADLTTPTCCAIFSPDGKRIAVGAEESDSVRGPTPLMGARIVNRDGTFSAFIPPFCGACASTRGVDFVPGAWSPDGSLIAVEVSSATDTSLDGINLAPVGFGNDWSIQVTGAHPDVPLSFSPDGSRLLFARRSADDSNTGALYSVTVKVSKGIITVGSPIRVSPDGASVQVDGYLGAAGSWSPDGKRIAFAATDGVTTATERVYVVDVAGGTPVAITDPGAISTAAWSPDGQWIAFDGAATSVFHDELIVRPDGTRLTNLTETFGPGVCCGRWQPDSTALLVAGTTGADARSELLIVPIDGGPVAQVTRAPGFYQDFSWSATGP